MLITVRQSRIIRVHSDLLLLLNFMPRQECYVLNVPINSLMFFYTKTIFQLLTHMKDRFLHHFQSIPRFLIFFSSFKEKVFFSSLFEVGCGSVLIFHFSGKKSKICISERSVNFSFFVCEIIYIFFSIMEIRERCGGCNFEFGGEEVRV